MLRERVAYRLLVVILLALGGGLRLFDLTDQPIDFHPTRQLRGAIVARGIYYQMNPAADEETRRKALAFWESTGQYEPSLLESMMALTYLAIGKEALWVGRVINTLFWLAGGLALLGLARRLAQGRLENGESEQRHLSLAEWSALGALAFYLVLPFSVQASRSLQPDPSMVAWLLLAAFALFRWSEERTWRWCLAAGISSGMAVFTKAVALYPLGGVVLALMIHGEGSERPQDVLSGVRNFLKQVSSPQLWLIGVLTLLPSAIFYLSRQGRAAEYFSSWTLALSHLLLQPAFYGEWAKMIASVLSPLGCLIAIAGLALAKGKGKAVLLGWGLGYMVYGLFLPYQMNTHNYYHLQLVPWAALAMTPAITRGLTFLKTKGKLWRWATGSAALLLLIWMSWQALIPLYSKDYRSEPVYWQTIASYLPEEGKIIALTQDYGYRLMYYGWRKVTLWPNRGEIKLSHLRGSTKEFEEYFRKRTEGKRYFLITAFRQFEEQPALQEILYSRYTLIAEGPGYLIFDLSQPKQ